MEVTLDIPDDLAQQLKDLENQLPEILKKGVEKLNTNTQTNFDDFSDIIELLITLPSPEEIIALKPSEKLQNRIDQLLNKNRDEGLSPEEKTEWAQYEYFENLVRLAKANAVLKLENHQTT